jgi:hypothetical protein
MRPRAEGRGEELTPVASVIWTAGMEPELLEAQAATAENIIIVASAIGSLPKDFHPVIEGLIRAGKQVFILPDNVGELHGVRAWRDMLQEETAATGATYLDMGNVRNERAVNDAIRAAYAKGLRGTQLAEAVRAQFKEPEK